MVKIMLVTTALITGRVINTKEITLPEFTRAAIAEYGERADYGSFNEDRLELVSAIPTPQHRSIEYVNDNLIVRYMDQYPQYFYKK